MEAYPKVWNLGNVALKNLLDGEVIVEEKVDGSQFSFQRTFTESRLLQLKFRSRGREMYLPTEDKLFKSAMEYVQSIEDLLVPGWIYRGEVLCHSKHNTIAYGRVPRHNVVIFDIERGEQDFLTYEQKVEEATRLDLEVAPVLWKGKLSAYEALKLLLEAKSFLYSEGITPTIEGLVIKNYQQFGRDHKVLMGKWVREEFKEAHSKNWKNQNPNRGDMIFQLVEIYKNENRWEKAIQHLKEKGVLQNDPRDIGGLMKEVQRDVLVEEEEAIKEALFKWGWKQIGRGIVRGLPEFYKERLAKEQFNES